jgi:hypothetical protein
MAHLTHLAPYNLPHVYLSANLAFLLGMLWFCFPTRQIVFWFSPAEVSAIDATIS